MSGQTEVLTGRVTVVGAGSWGTALAAHAARQGLSVTLWARTPAVAAQINQERENRPFLPDLHLPSAITATADLEQALPGRRVVVVVVPSHVMRAVARRMAPHLSPGTILISASKGIEDDTSATMARILEEELPGMAVGAISGPSFAREVARGLPTAVTLALRDQTLAKALQTLLSSPMFRIYTSEDILGVELGGALKNVYAIAIGICDGLTLGSNARAALLTRAMAEMSRLAVSLGANPRTLMGLSGLGDLVLTATGDLSRNRRVGLRLGQGEKLEDILAGSREVAEGVRNARSVHQLAERREVAMPLAREVYRVLYEDKDLKHGLTDLLTRRLKVERE